MTRYAQPALHRGRMARSRAPASGRLFRICGVPAFALCACASQVLDMEGPEAWSAARDPVSSVGAGGVPGQLIGFRWGVVFVVFGGWLVAVVRCDKVVEAVWPSPSVGREIARLSFTLPLINNPHARPHAQHAARTCYRFPLQCSELSFHFSTIFNPPQPDTTLTLEFCPWQLSERWNAR